MAQGRGESSKASSSDVTGSSVGKQQTKCQACPLRKLDLFSGATGPELDFMEWFKTGEFVADEGASLMMEGHSSPHLYTILTGWAFRYKTLPDGRRQILNFALPGDFLGLQTSMFGEMQHSVDTLTKTVLCVFPRDRLWSLYEKHPGLAFDLTWIAARSERLVDEQLLAVGRRSARERVAFVLMHLFQRVKSLTGTAGNKAVLPFTQQHLADALGMSLVHTNKTLNALARDRLCTWKNGTFAVLDMAGMKRLTMIDDAPEAKRPLI